MALADVTGMYSVKFCLSGAFVLIHMPFFVLWQQKSTSDTHLTAKRTVYQNKKVLTHVTWFAVPHKKV